MFWGLSGGASGKQVPLPMQETHEIRVQSLGQEDPLEWTMATYSSILAWKTPWTEPSRLQSIGSQTVGHEQACTHTCAHTHTDTHTHTVF